MREQRDDALMCCCSLAVQSAHWGRILDHPLLMQWGLNMWLCYTAGVLDPMTAEKYESHGLASCFFKKNTECTE